MGRDLKDGEFTFTLEPVADGQGTAFADTTEGAAAKAAVPMPKDDDGNVVNTAKNALDGSITWSIPFTQENLFNADGSARTYYYKVTEKKGDDEGVNYSEQSFIYTVTPADKSGGTIGFTATANKTPIFENTLKTGNLKIQKLTDVETTDEFKFRVQITGADGQTISGDYEYKTESVTPLKGSVDVDTEGGATLEPGVTLVAAASITNAGFDATHLVYEWHKVDANGNDTVVGSGIELKTDSDDAEYYVLVSDSTGEYPGTLESDKVSTKKANVFAVYSADDNSLRFYNRADKPSVGDVFESKTVTAVYTGFDTASAYSSYMNVPWRTYRSDIKSVAVVDKFSAANTAYWFYGFTAADGVTFDLANLNASKTKSMAYMFGGTSSAKPTLKSITLPSGFGKTATNVSYMFNYCSALTSVSLPSGFGQSAEDMSYLFNYCSALTSVSLPSGFGAVATNMNNMFNNCSKLPSITVPEGFGEKVLTADSMFQSCTSLSSLSLPAGFAKEATSANYMFNKCSALTGVSFGEGSFSAGATSMSYMFGNCSKLEYSKMTLPENFGAKATKMNYMFTKCSALGDVVLPSGFGGEVTNVAQMFYYCSGLTTIVFPEGFGVYVTGTGATANGSGAYQMFSGIDAASSMKVSSITFKSDLGSATSSTSRLTMSNMFAFCSKLTTLSVPEGFGSHASSMSSAFHTCTGLKMLDLSTWNTKNVSSAKNITNNCQNLAVIKVGKNINSTVLGALNGPDTYFVGGKTDRWLDAANRSNYYTVGSSGTLMNQAGIVRTYVASTSTVVPASLTTASVLSVESTSSVILSEAAEGGVVEGSSFSAEGEGSSTTGASAPSAQNDGGATVQDASSPEDGEATVLDASAQGASIQSDEDSANGGASLLADDVYTIDENGGFDVTVQANKAVTISDLPGGASYSIYEYTAEGWVLVREGNTSGTIEPNDTVRATFENEQSSEATTATLVAAKTLDGVAPAAGSYSFTLEPDGDAPMPSGAKNDDGSLTVTNSAGGQVLFGTITYTKEGIYGYTIYEVAGTEDGIDYDLTVYNATVTVTPVSAGLKAEVEYTTTVLTRAIIINPTTETVKLPTFKNTTKATSLTLTKTVDGETPADDAVFTFRVSFDGSDTTSTVKLNKDNGWTYTWDKLTYKTSFTIEETDVPDGYTFSGFSVTDSEYGTSTSTDQKLVGSFSVGGQDIEVTANNSYSASGSFSPTATKTLAYSNERALEVKDGAFSFVLYSAEYDSTTSTATYDISASAEPVSTGATATGVDASGNAIPGEVVFEPVPLTEEGTFYYVMREVIPDEAWNEQFDGVTYGSATQTQREASGWTNGEYVYDATSKLVQVEVNDNNEGVLVPTVTYPNESVTTTAPVFANTVADGEMRFGKLVTLGDPEYDTTSGTLSNLYDTGSEKTFPFTVTLTDANGDALPGKWGYKVYSWDTSTMEPDLTEVKGSGEVASGDTINLAYAQVAVVTLPLDAEYTVAETAPTGYTAWVENNDAEVPTYSEGSEVGGAPDSEATTVTFVNAYAPEGSWQPIVSKSLKSGTLYDGQFSFKLYELSGDPTGTEEVTEDLLETVKNDGKGKVAFSSYELSQGDLATGSTEATVHYYRIREVNGGLPGVTYDDSYVDIAVTTTDDKNGNLVAKAVWTGSSDSESKTVDSGASGYTFENEVSYEMPSAGLGGLGLLTVGGVVCMASGAVGIAVNSSKKRRGRK